ncbi:MAG: aminopeptidase P family protein [Provencibacterium sp.]|nr:aminopeptidase P family protein [Provencibacterium sp.]
MRQPSMLDFPLEEYRARLDRLLAGMQRDGLDAVLITGAENMRYFTGLQSVVWSSGVSTPGVCIITGDRRVATISSVSSLGPIRESSWVEEEDMFAYGRGAGDLSYEDAIFAAFERLHLQSGRIGMEWGTGFRIGLQAGYYFPLMEKLQAAGARLSDAARLLWELRTVKSPREIACVRKAVQAAEKMFDAAFSGVRLGESTERELFGIMGATALEEGCEDLLPMVVRFGPERMKQVNCPASDLVIANTPGAILHLDGGPCYKGYYADIIRQAVVGELSDKQREYEKCAIEAMEAGLSRVRAGVPISEISRAVDASFEKNGLGACNDSPGWSGHGIGLDVHEEPQLSADSDYILRAGMTLSLEPGMKIPGIGSFCNEQNFVVTETGYELLSLSPLQMRRL